MDLSPLRDTKFYEYCISVPVSENVSYTIKSDRMFASKKAIKELQINNQG